MEKIGKKVVVISGVNLIEAGPLSVFKDAISGFNKHFHSQYSLVLLVNSKQLFLEYTSENISFYEYPIVKRSWLFRLWFEYVSCYFISKRISPFLWLALHDITPNVIATKRALYCHNSSPFYKANTWEAKMEPTFFLFSLFYGFLYKINIKSNDYVIVQQEWIRQIFLKDFKVKNVIVAHPDIPPLHVTPSANKPNAKTFSFIYPAFPRVFKNFETLLDAAKILSQSRNDFEVIVTMSGTENAYSRFIYQNYSYLKHVKFIGIQSRENVLKLYNEADCLVFPSKLETWGLPISEMKYFDKLILVADENYARETVGEYEKVKYFKTNTALELADLMKEAITGNIVFEKNDYEDPMQPFSKSWKDLFNLLLGEM